MANRIDEEEKEKRIYQVGLLLFNRSSGYIVQFIAQKWNLKRRQAYNYIRLARKEWSKYFTNTKRCGMAYHIAKRRDIRNRAIEEGDLELALKTDIDEAKLLRLYIEKIEIEEVGDLANAKKKLISKLDSLAAKKRERRNIK